MIYYKIHSWLYYKNIAEESYNFLQVQFSSVFKIGLHTLVLTDLVDLFSGFIFQYVTLWRKLVFSHFTMWLSSLICFKFCIWECHLKNPITFCKFKVAFSEFCFYQFPPRNSRYSLHIFLFADSPIHLHTSTPYWSNPQSKLVVEDLTLLYL